MKRALLSVALRGMLLAACAPAVSPRAVQAAPAPADAVVARINGEPLMLSEIKQAALDQEVPLGSLLSEGMQGHGFRRALTQLVDEKLLVQQAKRDEITPREQEIAKHVDAMIQGLREQMGSEESMQRYLRTHYMNIDGLRRMLTDRERRGMMADELVARRVQINDGKIEAFTAERQATGGMLYEVRLSQILVLCTPEQRRSPEGREIYLRALQVARDASARPDQFDKFAKQKSDDAGGRVTGGYLGWIDSTSMQPKIWERVKELKAGEISEPILTDLGYHIIRLHQMNGPRDLLFQQEFEKERVKLIEELRAKAAIQFYDFQGEPIKEGPAAQLEAPAPKPTETPVPAEPTPQFAPASPAVVD